MRTAVLSATRFSRIRGLRRYELSNHLGNVMAVVSDRKVVKAVSTDISYYADVVSSTDYYAFGMVMADRSFNTEGYRFGFNGKENDNEVKGTGNQQDYGMRIYDARLGRFLSVDPLTSSYPWYTPYQFAGNMPIIAIDLDGGEEKIVIHKYYTGEKGRIYNSENVILERDGVRMINADSYNDKSINSQINGELHLIQINGKVGASLWIFPKDNRKPQKGGIAFTLKATDESGKVLQQLENRIAENYELVEIDEILNVSNMSWGMRGSGGIWGTFKQMFQRESAAEKVKTLLENMDNIDDVEGAVKTIIDSFQSDDELAKQDEKKQKSIIRTEFIPKKYPKHEKIKMGKDTIEEYGTRVNIYSDGTRDSLKNIKGKIATEKKVTGKNSSTSTAQPIH